jgi:hypothetical protein
MFLAYVPSSEHSSLIHTFTSSEEENCSKMIARYFSGVKI